MSSTPATSPLIGATLRGRYRIDAELGAGGMGAVYRAHDLELGRDVAVKVVTAARGDAESPRRLLREARAAAVLQHPRIAAIFDVGEDAGTPYVVMELVAGGNLHGWRPSTFDDVIEAGLQICAGLEHAHARGVVHRDVKPENVLRMAGPGLDLKLADLGLALATGATRLTADGAVLGTPDYIAPEQALGREVDGRADLYALGAMLYELVAGRPPFTGADAMTVLSQHLYAPVVAPRTFRPEVPAALERVILKLLAKEPERRYASATAAAAALREARAEIAAAPAGAPLPAGAGVALLEQLVRGTLVGRASELEQLRALWRRAQDGECHLALLSGEPGAGKTRLARELVATAQLEGAVVLRGGCYEFEATTPYLPWVEAMRQWVGAATDEELRTHAEPLGPELVKLAPELATRLGAIAPSPSLAPAEERLRLFDHLTRWLRGLSERRGLLLFIDDLHWADQGTIALLHYALRQLGRARVLVLAGYREVELGREHPLAAALVDWNRERLATRIPLGRLSREDTHRLLATLLNQDTVSAPFGDAVFRETEGNPFFAEEVVKALIDQGTIYWEGGEWHRRQTGSLAVPQSVKVAIGHRLTRLSEPCLETLRIAAALGKDFAFAALAAASERSEDALLDALDEAVAAQLVTPAGADGFVFTHDKIREVLYEEINPVRRRRLHQRIGEALERLHAGAIESHAQDLSHHFAHSGDLERAMRHSISAAVAARRVFAFDEALGFYARARECAEGLERPEALAEIERETGYVHDDVGNHQRAAEHFERALGLERDPGRRTLLEGRIGQAYVHLGDPRGIPVLERAIAALDVERQPFESALVIMALARYEHLAGRHGAAYERLQSALAAAERAGDPRLTADVMTFIAGTLQHLARFEESDEYARRVVALGERRQDPMITSSGWEFLAENANNRGRSREGLAAAEREVAIADRYHLANRRAWALYSRGWALAGLGRLAEAESQTRAAIEEAERIGELRLLIFLRAGLASVLVERGVVDEARRVIEQVIADGDARGLVFLQVEGRRQLVLLHLARGDAGAAVETLDACAPLLARTEGRVHPKWLQMLRAEAELRRGRGDAARAPIEEALRLGVATGDLACAAGAHRLSAELAIAETRLDDAERAIEHALAALGDEPAPLLRARIDASRSRLHAARGDAAAASAARERALETMARCGAAPAVLGFEV